jgi:hypothetical protein
MLTEVLPALSPWSSVSVTGLRQSRGLHQMSEHAYHLNLALALTDAAAWRRPTMSAVGRMGRIATLTGPCSKTRIPAGQALPYVQGRVATSVINSLLQRPG